MRPGCSRTHERRRAALPKMIESGGAGLRRLPSAMAPEQQDGLSAIALVNLLDTNMSNLERSLEAAALACCRSRFRPAMRRVLAKTRRSERSRAGARECCRTRHEAGPSVREGRMKGAPMAVIERPQPYSESCLGYAAEAREIYATLIGRLALRLRYGAPSRP